MAKTDDFIDPTQQQDLARAFDQAQPGQVPAVSPPGAGVTIEHKPMGAQRVAVMRDEARVLAKIKALAAAAGSDWFYRFPVKDRKTGRTNFITGPSIKLANNIARLYGNCDIDVRLVDNGASWWIYAKFFDLESGFAMVRPFQQDKGGSRMGGSGPEAEARRLDIALQIGVSKAIRNIIVNSLEIHCDFAFEEAQKNLVSKIAANVDDYRARAVKWFADHDVPLQQVEQTMGRPSKDWLAPDIARLAAEIKSCEDQMALPAELWPAPIPPEPRRDHTDVETSPPSEAIPQAATARATAASQPEPSGDAPAPPSTEAQAASPLPNWRIGDDVVGHEAIWRTLGELISLSKSDEDRALIREQNAARIAKFSQARKLELNRVMTDRAAEQHKGDDE